ncbi:MAG TPA: glycosyltransferase family 2 protein [Balneolaceae bacterium]|nr:glycosyltransferase family 2 protein [Balneolaceae bacterium]
MIDPITLFWLTSFSLLFLLFTSVILLRNRVGFTSLSAETSSPDSKPLVSICVPARNEEDNLERLLSTILAQTYPAIELLVLDDFSTDDTPAIIEKFNHKNPDTVTVVPPSEKPDGWLGKPWACHQLANRANGHYLLFLDADTALRPQMVQQTVNAFNGRNLDMITVWPEQELGSFWEKTVVPLIYYALVTLLPAVYVYRSPRWLPSFLNKQFATRFAAACGQCIGFTREAYQSIGGHKAVKDEVVEDVALSKLAKENGHTLRMFTGIDTISCRMYRSEEEIFNGLRKNFFAGFDRSIPLFTFMGLIHLVVFVLPFIVFPYAIYLGSPALLFVSAASITLILLHRFILAIWFRWNPIYGFMHPLAVLWYQRLGIYSVTDYIMNRKVFWKGREV